VTYIITMTTPYADAIWDPEDPIPPRITRHEADTLNEVESVVDELLNHTYEWTDENERAMEKFYRQNEALTESGGIIGPLLDGSVIKVVKEEKK